MDKNEMITMVMNWPCACCDGSGSYATSDPNGDPEENQCQFCFERNQVVSALKGQRADSLMGQAEMDECHNEILNLRKHHSKIMKTLKRCYRKHHLMDESIGWNELSHELCDTLCEAMGDAGYQNLLAEIKESK